MLVIARATKRRPISITFEESSCRHGMICARSPASSWGRSHMNETGRGRLSTGNPAMAPRGEHVVGIKDLTLFFFLRD